MLNKYKWVHICLTPYRAQPSFPSQGHHQRPVTALLRFGSYLFRPLLQWAVRQRGENERIHKLGQLRRLR